MPAASSIYWDSVGSLRSSDSSCGTGSARQYVDPWDLENYVYLRRHSVVTAPQHVISSSRAVYSRISYSRKEPESHYWFSRKELHKEPGYHAPASVEELYFGPIRYINPTGSSKQPISDDRNSQYAPLYQPLSDLDYQRFEDLRMKEVIEERKISRAEIFGRDFAPKPACIYHSTSSNIQRETVEKMLPKITKNEENCYIEVIPPSNIGLNSYGHLKIDYTNSWNSLHRKMNC